MAKLRKLRHSFEKKVLAGFLAAAFVVVALSATTWKLAEDSRDAAQLVSRTYQIANAIAQSRADTLEIEFSTQSYRISGDEAVLDKRNARLAEREITMGRLHDLLADSPAQLERWKLLRTIIDERVAIAKQVEMLRTTKGLDVATAYVAGAPLRETRERTYALFDAMAGEARAVFKLRTAEQLEAHRVMAATGSAAALLLAALLAGTFVLIRRQLGESESSQRALIESEANLERNVHERTLQLRDTQEHLTSVMSSVPAMIAYVDSDRRYVYVNEQYRARFAPDGDEVTGMTVREVLGEDRYAVASPIIDKVLAGVLQNYDWQPFPGVWQAISYVPKRGAGDGVLGYYVLGADITQRKQAEDRVQILNSELAQRVSDLERVTRAWKTLSAGNSAMLRATEEQELLDTMCKAIVDAGGYPIAMVWYGLNDAEQTLRPMAESGYGSGMALLQTLKISWKDCEQGRGAIATAIRTGATQVIGDMQTNPNYRQWVPILLGHSSCIACPLVVGGVIIGALAIFAFEPDTFGPDEARLLAESADDLAFGIASLRANAERARAEDEMRRLTRFDAMTGLPNETQFIEVIARAMDDARTNDGDASFALLQIDIERLSEINDALGFAHGDQLLREFGNRLRAAAPDASRVARLRGDEFAVLLSPGDESRAMAMASRVLALLEKPFSVADIFLDVGARIGIALYPAHGSAASDLLRHVDVAVKQAKRRQLGFSFYDPATTESRPDRLTMAGQLRRAIENGDMRLYLQPKIDFASGHVLGAEALVRWQHADRGLIPPGQFIGLAERTGLIKNLTEWVVESAMRVCHEAQHQGEALPIAVNLSARNLRDESLLGRVRLLQKSWGVAPGLLEFEITESTVMEDPEFALRILRGLRAEGIPLYIDDFGTGYSSLSYMLKLPVEYIKIDQSFVRDMSTNEDSAVIVKSTIDLAHDLGRKVVAEGIETQQDWDRLAELGCDIAQGYFIAKPMPAGDFAAWVKDFTTHRVVESLI